MKSETSHDHHDGALPDLVNRPSRKIKARPSRILVSAAVLFGLLAGCTYYLAVTRPAERRARIAAFQALDAQWDCCNGASSEGQAQCTEQITDIVRIARELVSPTHWPTWVPFSVRELVDLARGVDHPTTVASSLVARCPMAQEIAASMDLAGADQLCGVLASPDEREELARQAARRGTLAFVLRNQPCSVEGYEAGLERILIEFNEICARDACIDVLMNAPPALNAMVRSVVLTNPEAILAASLERLRLEWDERVVTLMTHTLSTDARPLAALFRGDLSELHLTSASDLLELPLHPRKVALLRTIRDAGTPPASSVAAVFLDAADATLASEQELREGLKGLMENQCALLEKAVLRLDLGAPSRADAAVVALIGCPKAAQLVLADGDRLALTPQILTEALAGKFGEINDVLLERLDSAGSEELQSFLAVLTTLQLSIESHPIYLGLLGAAEKRLRILHGHGPAEESEVQPVADTDSE